MRLEDLMERAAQYDENLARDIKDYVHGRKYGLVYEASKPEFVRMWKKPVVRGDIVNILPPRGVMEDTKNDDDPSEIVYKVISISDGIATLRNEQTDEIATASVDDIVALARFDKPIYAGLKETGRIDRGGDKPYHVVINGENYHALQTLVYAYQGQVDCIYIDPPYNSGAKDWKYNNNYVGKDDIYRHSKWLTFMEDRLKLAKKLLNPRESVLIVTIDEKEYLRLGLLLEQLFPEARIQMISSLVNPKGVSRDGFRRADEYLYFVMFGNSAPLRLNLCDEWSPSAILSSGNNNDGKEGKEPDWTSMMRRGSNSSRKDRKDLYYPIYVDESTKTIVRIGKPLPEAIDRDVDIDGLVQILPIRSNGTQGRWQVGPNELKNRIEQGRIRLGRKTHYGYVINYLPDGAYSDVVSGKYEIKGRAADGSIIAYRIDSDSSSIAPTQWKIASHNASENGSTLLSQLLPKRKFPFPKSLYAVEDTLRFFIANKPNALVVDFFSGSGTTAHAVMRLNHQDGGKRYCISVTNNEISEEEAKALTELRLRQGDDDWERIGIAQFITIPRIVASISGKDCDGNVLSGNYGIETEEFKAFEGDITDPETGRKMRGKLYKKVKVQSPSVPDPFPMSEGFEENAVFFDLEYLEPSVVNADLAFDRIAPILWLCGGCEGRILHRQKGFVIGETYAILFDPRYKTRFVEAVTERKRIKTAFIVTDAAERYRTLSAELPDCRVMQLYESYLRSFEINAIG